MREKIIKLIYECDGFTGTHIHRDKLADQVISAFKEMVDWTLTPHEFESDNPEFEKFACKLKDKLKKKLLSSLTQEDK